MNRRKSARAVTVRGLDATRLLDANRAAALQTLEMRFLALTKRRQAEALIAEVEDIELTANRLLLEIAGLAGGSS